MIKNGSKKIFDIFAGLTLLLIVFYSFKKGTLVDSAICCAILLCYMKLVQMDDSIQKIINRFSIK